MKPHEAPMQGGAPSGLAHRLVARWDQDDLEGVVQNRGPFKCWEVDFVPPWVGIQGARCRNPAGGGTKSGLS